MATHSICSIPDCGKLWFCRGWCSAHYQRWREHGDPLAGSTAKGKPERYFRDVVLVYDGNDCLAWPYGRRDNGYGSIHADGKNHIVSRRLCEEVNGPPPTPGHEAAHSCGNGHLGCCTKRHLSWKTPKENEVDKLTHGTRCRGERNGVAKLTEADVHEIRALRGSMTQSKIAAQFNLRRQQISRIHTGTSWAWLVDCK